MAVYVCPGCNVQRLLETAATEIGINVAEIREQDIL